MARALRPGRTVNGFALLGVVGQGSHATVWRARRTSSTPDAPEIVALKQSRIDGADMTSVLRADRTMGEGRIALLLSDVPQVIAVQDMFEERGSLWLVEEYFDSMSLRDLIAARGRLDPGEVAWIGTQIATALEAAHDRDIVHRDLSPSNVLVARSGESAKLADFGVARQFADPRRTTVGAMVGTPAYKSPEEGRGASATPASDVFSLAAVLYEAVEGQPPFGDHEPEGLLDRVRAGEIPEPRHAGPLSSLLADCLLSPARSRPSATDVAERLYEMKGELGPATREVLRPATEPAEPDESPPRRTPSRRTPRRRRGRVLAGLVTAAAVIAAAVLLVVDRSTAGEHAGQGLDDLPDSIPAIRLTGDPRTLDPCGLLDLDAISEIGPATVAPGRVLTGCSAYLGTPQKAGAAAEISFYDPWGDDDPTELRAAPVNLGGAEIRQYKYGGGGCDTVTTLADRTPVHVTAHSAEGQTASCRLADVVTAGAARRLARDGLQYDRKRLDAVGVARLDPCLPAVPDAALEKPFPYPDTLNAAERTSVPEAGLCSIGTGSAAGGSYDVQFQWQLLATGRIDEGSRVVSLRGRKLEVFTPEPAGSAASHCVGYLQMKPRSALAPDTSEYLLVSLDGPSFETDICNQVVSVATTVEASLPQVT
ncbi:serine/threonine-protein kinase [Pseudonocardia phyllosphaerae]|uniref:serine/threonine-protein kinase n=1 Tax=Pseudonocardia phyllosphaerae TaxID=3390502 RepID=UPI0039790DA7